jgi:beta-lactamase superfamily II metal-dependent hydrolase
MDMDDPDWWTNRPDAVAVEGSGHTRRLTGQNCTVSQANPPADSLRLHFIDVAQGDAIWVQTPTGENILIDAGDGTYGRTNGGAYVVSYLSERGFQGAFDALFITHPHSDHYGGVDTVVASYPVNAVVDPGLDATTQSYGELITDLRSRVPSDRFYRPAVGPNGLVARLGDRLPADIFGNSVEAWMLNSSSSNRFGNVNNVSIVLKLRFAGRSVLLTGDIEQDIEQELGNIYGITEPYLDTHILKVSHHGSSTASTSGFLQLMFKNTLPEKPIAIISSGRRPFGDETILPTSETVYRFQQLLGPEYLYSTESGDEGKAEEDAAGDDDIIAVIMPTGAFYACYVDP